MVNSLIKDVMMFCVNRDIVVFFKDEDAITYMKRSGFAPDLVISRFSDDYVNGAKVTEFVKQQKEECVVVLSSDDENDKISFGSSGANAFLPIPFSIDDLFNIVDEFVVDA